MSHYVVDIETIKNCFILVAEDYKSDDKKKFVVSSLRNNYKELLIFLNECITKKQWHITFNGLNFDSQVIQHILDNDQFYVHQPVDYIVSDIYGYAQLCIAKSRAKQFQEYRLKDLKIGQIDVFKLNHWEPTSAKACSLKWAEFTMDWDDLRDMPFDHTKDITTIEELNEAVIYCGNDVSATKRIYEYCKEGIGTRKSLTEQYNVNLYSESEPGIGREIFLIFLSNKLGISKYDLKKMRTYRDFVRINDTIFPYVKFQTEIFNNICNAYKNLIVKESQTKDSFSYTLQYKNTKTDFKLGGIHGATEPGIYKSDKDVIIKSLDVTSFYPFLAMANKLSPAHIDKELFCEQYRWFFDERKKYAKGSVLNYLFKIILNCIFGLSYLKEGFLYDLFMGLSIVVNGQLSLAMLYEEISIKIPESQPLMQNTDGMEVIIPRSREEEYHKICSDWEKLTGLSLEHANYDKLFMSDSNNYIGLFNNGKTKCKGKYEWEPFVKYDLNIFHKNKSFLIVRKAVYNFFINGIMPERFIKENHYIYDYCACARIKGRWEFLSTEVINREIVQTKLQDTVRYYMSTKGCKIVKRNIDDGRVIQLEAGHHYQTVFNKKVDRPFKDYNIDEKFYLGLIHKEINNISSKNLFNE